MDDTRRIKMTKYFCDRCKNELKTEDHVRLKLRLGDHSIEVMTALNDVWNNGNICHKCVKEIVARGKACK
jgi:hypothetical protein